MSSIWKQPTSSLRQKELAWRNIMFQTHDTWCHCDNVDLHMLICMNKFSGFQKPEIDIRNIQCLLTGPTGKEDTGKDEETDAAGFLNGELEDLFKEEDTKEEEDVDPTR